jgi:hypothetical protein
MSAFFLGTATKTQLHCSTVVRHLGTPWHSGRQQGQHSANRSSQPTSPFSIQTHEAVHMYSMYATGDDVMGRFPFFFGGQYPCLPCLGAPENVSESLSCTSKGAAQPILCWPRGLDISWTVVFPSELLSYNFR